VSTRVYMYRGPDSTVQDETLHRLCTQHVTFLIAYSLRSAHLRLAKSSTRTHFSCSRDGHLARCEVEEQPRSIRPCNYVKALGYISCTRDCLTAVMCCTAQKQTCKLTLSRSLIVSLARRINEARYARDAAAHA
jgi:hypothetical protein